MTTLIIDSATKILYTCLLDAETIVYESYIEGQNDHAKSILVEIEKACQKAGLDLKNISKVIVGYGPGSYTGVRMAVSVGKIIATLEPKIELNTISTLLLMASGSEGRVQASIDARRGNCFGCAYDTVKEQYILPEALLEKNILDEQLVDYKVTEQSFQVNPLKVVKWSTKVEEPRTLVPNYLRQTEAERNLQDEKI